MRSTARRFATTTRPFLIACYGATLLLLAAAGWVGGLSWLYYPALLLPAAMLGRQVMVLDIHNPALCLALFKANRDVGLAVALAIVIGRW